MFSKFFRRKIEPPLPTLEEAKIQMLGAVDEYLRGDREPHSGGSFDIDHRLWDPKNGMPPEWVALVALVDMASFVEDHEDPGDTVDGLPLHDAKRLLAKAAAEIREDREVTPSLMRWYRDSGYYGR